MPVKKKAVKKRVVKRKAAPKATASTFKGLLNVYMGDMRAADVLKFIDNWSLMVRSSGTMARESDLLWEMLTALRGPDLTTEQMGQIARARGLEPPVIKANEIKMATTARLRARMFPKDFGGGLGDKNFDGLPANVDLAGMVSEHFAGHIQSAKVAVQGL